LCCPEAQFNVKNVGSFCDKLTGFQEVVVVVAAAEEEEEEAEEVAVAVRPSYRGLGGMLDAQLEEGLSDIQYLECSFTIR